MEPKHKQSLEEFSTIFQVVKKHEPAENSYACDSVVYSFSRQNPPALIVSSGSQVTLQTLDCFSNQFFSPKTLNEGPDNDYVNPVTGPIYIENTGPGDILKISILSIEIQDTGILVTGKGLGTLGNRIQGLESKPVSIQNNFIHFNSKISIPIKPMIGVIGVAPKEGSISSGTSGSHGGNMDNSMITEGVDLYLPIAVEGAFFGLGDLHARMGDGEICGSGIEVAGSVTVLLEVKKGIPLNNPLIETHDSISTIAAASSLDSAVQKASEDMANLLRSMIPLPMHEIAMLMSVIGNAQICQVIDPLKTARFTMPKWVLERYISG